MRAGGTRRDAALGIQRKRAEAARLAAQAELRVARHIQQRLFPAASPRVAGLDISGRSYPAEARGGDYFDYIPLPDGALALVIGDVSGHGMGPALVMASTRAHLRALAQTHTDVSAMLSLANQALLEDTDDQFVTLLLARLDPRRRTLVYASAGHPTGYVLDRHGGVKAELASTGLPLGVQAGADFPSSGAVPLEAGDMVLLLTDGNTEARSRDNTPFGSRRVLSLARLYRADPAGRIVENLYHAVRAFSQGLPQDDDISAVVVKVAAAGAGTPG
jgi:serine phosphatase RsbU (regulator of sigma subunit)